MAVLEMARLCAPEGQGDELERRLRQAIEYLVADADALAVELYRGVERPDELNLLVTWSSIAAHEAWRASSARDHYRALVHPAIRGPIEASHHSLMVRAKGD